LQELVAQAAVGQVQFQGVLVLLALPIQVLAVAVPG
jgi:hypothetical protein